MKTLLKEYGLLKGDLSAIARTAGVSAPTVRRALTDGPHVSDGTHAKVVAATKAVQAARQRQAQQRTIILHQLSKNNYVPILSPRPDPVPDSPVCGNPADD